MNVVEGYNQLNKVDFAHAFVFGPPEGGPILFLLSPEVSGMSRTMSIYIYIYIYIYISGFHLGGGGGGGGHLPPLAKISPPLGN